ncbi:MAG: polysaccharide biosynthesis/export family protein [Wenzhouxiangella sp.]
MTRLSLLKAVALATVALMLSACATRGDAPENTVDDFQAQLEERERVSEINEQLLMLAVDSGSDRVYRVGPEDRVRIDILGVEELSREYRINGAGAILLPLVGSVSVAGLSLGELEEAVADALAQNYLRNPQVSAEVTEYRSQQFTVVGAVENPRVYNTTRQTTLIEALAMAGGIDREAGQQVYLTDRVPDPDTGRPSTRTLIINIEDLMREAGQYNLVLGEGAMINVPRGGYVYVEGAVERPGAYAQRTDTSVLKALAEAGGLAFEADRSDIRVLSRNRETGVWESREIDYKMIRENPDSDVPLQNGDVVVVETSGMRSAWNGFLRAAAPIALLGFRPL